MARPESDAAVGMAKGEAPGVETTLMHDLSVNRDTLDFGGVPHEAGDATLNPEPCFGRSSAVLPVDQGILCLHRAQRMIPVGRVPILAPTPRLEPGEVRLRGLERHAIRR